MKMDRLIFGAKRRRGMRNNARVGSVGNVTADIASETENAPAAVRLNLIQVGIELDHAWHRRQGDQHGLDIHERQAERSNTGFTVDAMRIRGHLNIQLVALFIREYPLVDERRALTIRGELPLALKPPFRQPEGELSIRLKNEQPRAAFAEGAPAFPGSALYDRTHVQIAVRDVSLIENVWRLD